MSAHDYPAEEMRLLADDPEPTRPEVCAEGVAFFPDVMAGTLMTPAGARKLAAQLIRAADLYDDIWSAGMDAERAAHDYTQRVERR